MGTEKTTRAQRMAESYADVLIRAGVLQQRPRQVSLEQELQQKLASGETNWWAICLGRQANRNQ